MDTSADQARFNMIHQQVRPWDVLDEGVLSVMSELPREFFVPDAYRGLAYADIEVPIDEEQVMLAPKVVGRMLQSLAIRPDDRILEIGTGTGYVAACLSRLGARVVSIEIHASLAEQAVSNLQALGLRRVEVRNGDAFAGAIDGSPFDVIAVTGSVPTEEPLQGLREQLALGGRMFAFVGTEPVMEAMLFTRVASSDFRRQALFETSVPSLEKVPETERFVF